ncbi:hypothetical protein HS088_TW05G00647 [Tripterygium wilfordii]|uniref:DUF7036 domain-containing protein n=1 Tax=Tripterygium wilfordii TaxID=458696 RepID=A0A7J7DNM9_TRIWF|nr:hypothetical protein HS088_TW05G00647 [Tripterygium wilfordii]
MGKFEEQQSLPYTEGIDVSVEQNAEARFGYCRYCGVHKLIGLRCLLVLLVSMAVFLSALFWLPPFLHSTDQRDLDLDVKYRGLGPLCPNIGLQDWVQSDVPYPGENLYVSLSNSRGSTVAPPTTVQSSVLLAVGNTPSMPRLKQLARTITNSHSRNLGLNNTVFGRVKQVRLSSILQHSLHGGDGSGTGTSVSPSPAPLPYPQPQSHPHHHNHHHHHHHHHPHDVQLAPAIAPAPATEKTTPPRKVAPAPEKISPAPLISNEAKPPGCRNGIQKRVPGKTKKQSHLTPAAAPYISPHYSSPAPEPRVNSLPPAPVSSSIPPSSPLPNVVYAHVQPPSSRNPYEGYPGRRPSLPPSPLPSSSSADFHTIRWAFSLFLALVLHL